MLSKRYQKQSKAQKTPYLKAFFIVIYYSNSSQQSLHQTNMFSIILNSTLFHVSGLKNTHYLKRKRCAIICMKKGGAKNGKRAKLGGSHKAVHES